MNRTTTLMAQEPRLTAGQPPSGAAVPSRRRRQSARFTLIELVVAMSCFTLIVFALMSYLSTAQKAWTQSSGNCSVYENAQFVFDVIGKDLQCAIASSRDGEKIPFLFTNTTEIAFVACVPTNDNSRSDLSKIKYTKGQVGGKESIIRTQVMDNSDFFNPPATAPAATAWATGITTSSSALASGVENFSMICYADSTGTNYLPTNANSFQLPYAVNVSVTLYDESKGGSSADKNQSIRTFNRLFFIGGGSGSNTIR